MNRTNFLRTLGLGAAAFGLRTPTFAADPLPTWPVPDLKKAFPDPILIRSVELLKTQGEYLLMVTTAEGARGVTAGNDRMPHLTSLLRGLVLPHFVGKDARELPALVDNAYRLNSNYKYAGMPLWNCIGSVEIACWDLLGKLARKPVYALLGTPARTEYDVYISDFAREGDPEKIADQLLAKLAATGAKGVKIKIGGRMVNTPENAAQTRRYIPTLRKRLGDGIAIYADANGSYSPTEGIEAGRLLEDHGVAIFEEPCNFEDEEGTKSVNEALTKLKLAGGEQDTSLYKFRRLARQGVYDILQPDLYYNGGILRSLQVAKIAEASGLYFAPHTPKADPLIAPFWQAAALAPNLFGLQEFVYNPGQKTPTWFTPTIRVNKGIMAIPVTPGLGIDYDNTIWKSAERIV